VEGAGRNGFLARYARYAPFFERIALNNETWR